MSTQTSPSGALIGLPIAGLRWPHWQRLIERWLRRWGFALAGLLMGFGGMGFLQTEANDAHTWVRQEVVRLQQQVANLPAAPATRRQTPADSDPQNWRASLPGASRSAPVWADLQQLLSAHGLRLLSLKPLAATPGLAMPVAVDKLTEGRLSSQAIEIRLQGRFEDWSSTWAAITEAGPLCVIEQIRVAATGQTAEVQIDVVLRLWMRPGQHDGAWAGLTSALPRAGRPTTGLAGSFGGALFAQNRGVSEAALSAGFNVGDPAHVVVPALADPKPAAVLEVLSEDPQQWPLARVRLLGLWQQGSEQLAILSAGPHWAKVSPGQRVTLEGHRVAFITDKGVGLQLAQGPVIEILWAAKTTKFQK